MKLSLPRFTIQRMMVAVALSSALIPFPLSACSFVAIMAGAFFVADFFLGPWIDRGVEGRPDWLLAVALLFSVVSCSAGLFLLLLGPHPSGKSSVIAFGFAGLTAANFAGPFYMARRIRRGEPLAAGHLLWAWSALIWSVLLLLLVNHHPHRRGGSGLATMVESARLTLVVAVLLALYGNRPVGKSAIEAHYAGWILVECSVIVWGWYASTFLW